MLKTIEVEKKYLEGTLNEIGERNVLYILPNFSDIFHFQSYIIVYKEEE